MNDPRCVFEECWVGQCKAAGSGEPVLCERHREDTCWCGAQAIRQCGVAGSFVCGAPLCGVHECAHVGSGMTGDGPHSKKGQEQFRAWKAGEPKRRYVAALEAVAEIVRHHACCEGVGDYVQQSNEMKVALARLDAARKG